MEIRQLRYFVAVANELSFTQAAKKLNVSQPPLSHQIASLEEELGARLFERTSRRVELSECGKALLPHVQAMFRQWEEARSHVHRVAQGMVGCLHIGLTGSHFLGPFPRFITEFRQERPEVDLVLHEMPPTDQITALRDSDLDLCFERGVSHHKGLLAQLLWRDDAVLAMPQGHRLAHRKSVHLCELANENFVFLRSGSSSFETALMEACRAAGFEPRIVQQVVEVPAVLNLVAAGLGVSVVPGSLARLRADTIASCRLVEPPKGQAVSADVYLISKVGESRPLVLEFSQSLMNWAVEQQPGPLQLREGILAIHALGDKVTVMASLVNRSSAA